MSDKIKNLTMVRGEQDTEVSEHGTISMGPDGVKRYRILTIASGLHLELRHGMKLTGRAPSCFTIARKEFGLKGNKEKIYQAFCEMHGLTPKP